MSFSSIAPSVVLVAAEITRIAQLLQTCSVALWRRGKVSKARSLLTFRERQDTLVSVLELSLMTDACSEKTRLLMAYSAAVGDCARLMIDLSAKVGTA